MSKLNILTYPHPFLKHKADFVKRKEINNQLQIIIANMFETMYSQNGIGLAATQVGLNMRLFVMDDSLAKKKRVVAINPSIIEYGEDIIEKEGCLSFPGITISIKRAKWVKMCALDEFGKEYELKFENYLGRCVQHEIDHLNGITYLDHLSLLKRNMVKKKYKKFMKQKLLSTN